MFLKTLSLKGFKSFADSTRLDLEPGVTVVVGPNGSGKSNVVDAMAWVLGAQRPSAIRSGKMDDVIFAGTAKKKALGRAEVSITLDNTARLMPIEFEEVTITRRLFRTGDSEYEINGVPCRLLDIQELLSDSGVGRQQHVIISQGQIDAVLNARPEDRRSIIEEAAGVLKYRRRKEKSERRLESTEANLTRLQDLLREVRRQLKPLERQAEAARRHGDLIGELTQLRVHVIGREIADLRAKLESSAEEQRTFASRNKELSARLDELDVQVRDGETALGEAGADDIGDVLSRCESLRERLRGTDAVLAERIRSIDSDRQATVDGAVLSALEADREQIERDLADVDAREALLTDETERVEAAEAQLAEARTAFDSTWGDQATDVADETAKVRGELAAHTRNRQVLEAERSRLSAQREELQGAIDAANPEVAAIREDLTRIEAREADLVARSDQADTARAEVNDRHSAASAALDASRDGRATWRARVEALTLALDEIRVRSGADVLAEVDGVLGPLLDLVEIDEGYETALAAALGDASHGVVVRDADAAGEAAAVLTSADAGGVLLPLVRRDARAAGSRSIRNHVRGLSDEIEALLDATIAHIDVVNDWEQAVSMALGNSDAHIVTTEGASFSPVGWRVGAERLAATGAALDEAKTEVERSEALVDQRSNDLEQVAKELADATATAAAARAELNRCDDELMRAHEQLGALQRGATKSEARFESIIARLAEIDERLSADDERTEVLAARLTKLEADEAEHHEQLKLMETDQNRIDEQTRLVAGMRNDIAVRAKAITNRRSFLAERMADVEARLGRHSAKNHEAPEVRLGIANDLRRVLSAREAELDTWIDALRAQRRRQSEEVRALASELETARAERQKTDTELRALRDRQASRQIEEAETNVRLEGAMETLRRDLDVEVGEAMRTDAPPLPPGMTAAQRTSELERELRIMGPINPLALEEYETLSERHEFLQSQLDDVKQSRQELNKVIRAIDGEIVQVFSSAFADVAANFEVLFSTLFPGGNGGLKLTSPDDLLNTGIEVEARPGGKNVRKLSLLSGGERSLTALAFLFAVFRSRPSPFYVMDEVEAALDDVNLHRFLDLVAEFRSEAQLIIVSHQKRTMEAADCLYGVSMKSGESSRVVSERPGADMSAYLDRPVAAEATA
ncbi:MAG: chromosome segregation protein SMC [Actinomycetota bacterium]